MKLYHVTRGKYVEDILKNGLKVNSGKNGFISSKTNIQKYYEPLHGIQPIFLSSNYINLVREQLTPSWILSNQCKVLLVDVSGLKIRNEYHYLAEWRKQRGMEAHVPQYCDERFTCLEDISSDRISFERDLCDPMLVRY